MRKLWPGSPSMARHPLIATTVTESSNELHLRLTLPLAQLKLSRSLQLHGQNIRIHEVVENLSAMDRPLAWTQHVTLAPPFLDPATTQFRASLSRSLVSESDPGSDAYLKPGVEFTWPMAPRPDGEPGGPASNECDCSSERLYSASRRHRKRSCLVRGICAAIPAGVWLYLEAIRFPLVGYLGRKLQPPKSSLGRSNNNARHGIWRIALSRNAATDD